MNDMFCALAHWLQLDKGEVLSLAMNLLDTATQATLKGHRIAIVDKDGKRIREITGMIPSVETSESNPESVHAPAIG